MSFSQIFRKLTYQSHILINILIRLVLIYYGELQDRTAEVPYTDIDYKVVTDGAQHVLNGESPFERQTFRYSPLLAYLLIPNILLHSCFGKILFASFDILVGIMIKKIVYNELLITFKSNANAVVDKAHEYEKLPKRMFKKKPVWTLPERYVKMSEISSYFWLYNPLTMVIATRGNGDAITSLLVLFSLYFLMHPKDNLLQYLIAGVFHGLAIHFRIYPLIFSLAYYLAISECKYDNIFDFFKTICLPNKKQISLVLSTIATLSGITCAFYYLYEYKFLYETYIYHITRTDIRHNFSLYFYMQYLNSETELNMIDKLFIIAPHLIIQLCLSYRFGKHSKTLSFCLFAQSFIMVTFNTVITSQYFVWFLSLLPLCIKNLTKISMWTGISYCILWFLAQACWLLPAYLLEFRGWNTFEFIWLQSVIFFGVNIFLLQRLIGYYDVISNFKIKL